MPAEPFHSALHRSLLFCAGLVLAPALPAAEDKIFEPGSKHVCVPAASGEGWDCRSAEDGGAAPAGAKKESREPKLRSSSAVPDEAQTAPAPAAEPAAVAPVAEPPPAKTTTSTAPAKASTPPASAENSRRLPNYLLAPEAQSAPRAASAAPPAAPPPTAAAPARAAMQSPPPAPAATAAAQPAAAVPAAPAPAPANTAARATTTATSTSTATTAAPAETTAAAAEPRTTSTPPAATPAAATREPAAATPVAASPEPAPTRSTALATVLGGSEFRRLGDGRFVLELASGSDRGRVEDTASGLTLARGDIYLLPLQRDGAPWFVAVWGDFDSVDAARAARDEAAAAGATPGFPRRVGPLKQELR